MNSQVQVGKTLRPTVSKRNLKIWQTIPPPARCAFALCISCDENFSIHETHPSRDTVLEMEGGFPGLTNSMCRLCPSEGENFCPSHADYCILDCFHCEDSRCILKEHYGHTCWLERCMVCFRGACQAGSCYEARGGHRIGYCAECYAPTCNECAVGFPTGCPSGHHGCPGKKGGMRIVYDPIDYRF